MFKEDEDENVDVWAASHDLGASTSQSLATRSYLEDPRSQSLLTWQSIRQDVRRSRAKTAVGNRCFRRWSWEIWRHRPAFQHRKTARLLHGRAWFRAFLGVWYVL